MDGSGTSEHMCCYRCSRCHLEVYRQCVHYDRRDRPICDPDCDGTKPGTCIWCEQVIVGRPMLMFEKKVHRECWQYCVAKFGYDEIVRRYTSEDWEQFREREVGEDMVREMVEEFFDKFCSELVSDDDAAPDAEEATSTWGKKGEEDWGRAIRKVLRNKQHASLTNIASNKVGDEDENQWRGLSEGESIGAGSTRSANTAEGEEYCEEASLKGGKAKLMQRFHGNEERTEWLQAVQKSVCGDAFFDRESWADEAYRNTVGRNREPRDVTEDDARRHPDTDNTISIANTCVGRQNFVDNIIEEAVSVVKERSDNCIYKTVDGKQVVNYDKVWERSTRKKNSKLMAGANILKQNRSEDVDVDNHSEFNYIRNVLSSCKTSLVDKLIDEAAANYLESSEEESTSGIYGTLHRCKEASGADERSVFSKTWDEARAFRAMYEQTTPYTQSTSSLQQSVDNTSSEDTGGRESTCTINVDDQNLFVTNSSETAVGGEKSDGKKKSNKRRKRRNRQNVLDDEEISARQPSGQDLNSNTEHLVYEFASQENNIETSKSDLAVDTEIFDFADSAQSAANIAESGVENILTEEQLDELFGNALVASGDPGRLGQLVNEFKAAVGDIQHNANTCRECPKSGVSSASGNEYQSATEQFATVLAQLMDEVIELRNSILIFRKFARPDHICEKSINGDLLSSPQGEVYGTGNVLIIFDYGEEPLESDPASVYEYLANIYHDRESPRCFLHRTSTDRFDFSNVSEGNLSMYNGTDVTDSASMYRDVTSDVGDDVTSLATSFQTGLEDMSNYEEILWAETRRDRSESLGSLQVSSRLSGDLFCTNVESQAWEAMLNAGKSEEILSVTSFVESDNNEEKADNRKCDDHGEKNVVASGVSGSRSTRKKRSCDEVAHDGKSTTKQKTDAQLLDRLRSIKRINFDESLTNLRSTTGEERRDAAIVVRKSVSESDVSSYELCACSTHPSEVSVGGACAAGAECPTWKEVRRIVTESASSQPLQHSASVGANKEPTDVYQIAIEITINKRTDLKDQKKNALGCRSSSIDMPSFCQQSTTYTENISERVSDYEPEFKHKMQETVVDKDGDSEEMQSGILSKQDVENNVSNKMFNCDRYTSKVVAETTISYLADDSCRHGRNSHESSCRQTPSPPLSGINTYSTGSEREIEESVVSQASGKLNTIVGTVSNNNLIGKDLKNECCKRSSKHGIGSNKSTKVNLSCRRSNKDLNRERHSDETEYRKDLNEFSIDVDLFSIENISARRERKVDHQIGDGTSSNDDLFSIGMAEGKCSFDWITEGTDGVGQPSSEHAEETQASFLKERKVHTVQGNSDKKVSSGEEHKDLFDVVDGSNGREIVDPRSSNQVRNHSHEHDSGLRGSQPEDIPRQRSDKEIRVERLVGAGEIGLEETGVDKVESKVPTTSGKNVQGSNACGETVRRGTSSDKVNSKMSAGGQTDETVEGNVGEDVLKSCDVRPEEAEGSFITLTEEDIFLRLVNEPQTAKPVSLDNDVDTSKHKDVDFKTLVEEDIFLKTSPRSVQNSFVPNVDHDSSKHNTGDVFDSSLDPSLVLETAQETNARPETLIASFDYVEAPLLAEVASKRANLNILREAREDNANEARLLEYEFEKEVLVEQEIGCMSLCADDHEFDGHASKQNDFTPSTSCRRSTQVAFNSASPNKVENHHGTYLSHQEIDNEFSSRRHALHNTSSATTASDLESYKGNSTEEEQEVCTLFSTSEYGIDYQWACQCVSDSNIASGDMDGASVLTMVRERTNSKRVADVYGEDDIEDIRRERMENVPLAGGENAIEASSGNITRTSLVIDESEGENLKDNIREGNVIKKKTGIKNRKEKENLKNENLDEICRLDEDEDEAKHTDKRVTESTTVEVVLPGGKKSKRKKDKKDGRRKGSPTCVIL